MQTMAWTDERLEERFNSIELRFDMVDRRFDETNRRLDEMDRKFDRRLDNVESGMKELHSLLNRVGAGIIVSLFGVIAAILAKGG